MTAPAPQRSSPPEGRGAVQDWVLASLQRGLMSGLFLPGQVLSLRSLATSLGTSLTPVRESLSRLVAASALEELPNRTVRVPRLGVTGLTELFAVRVLIEGMAARIAGAKATAALVAELEAHNAALLAALAERDMAGVLVANQEFHFTIYQAANSDILMPLIESLWLRCGPTMYFSLNSPKNLWDTSQHLALLDAFRRGDARGAEKAIVADIRRTGDYLVGEVGSDVRSGPLATLARLVD